MIERIEQRGEFVPAHARDDVVGAHAGFQQTRHLAEDFIARVVAEGVIDALEAVQVDIEDGHPLAVAVDPRQRRLQRLMEAAAIEQPGERIGYRLGFQLRMEIAHHRHVQRNDHH